MEDDENKKKFSIKELLKVKGKAFYFALAICLVCVAGAAYSSINSWNQFNKPKDSLQIKTPEKSKKEAHFDKENSKTQEESKEVARPAKPSEQKANGLRPQEGGKPKPNEAPSPAPKATNTKAAKPKIVYPTGNKTVLKEFSGDNPVFSETLDDWRIHNGVDLEAEKGSVIKSITSGKIQSIKGDALLGKVVTIEHSDGILAEYCGLEEVKVQEGKNVKPEEEIGKLGDIPSESKQRSHLHLTIKKDGKFINPIDILGK